MEFRNYFKQMPCSQAVQDYAEDKLGRCIAKYVDRPIEAHVTFKVDNGASQVSCHVVAGGGLSIQAECVDSGGMYSCIDRLEDKLARRLRQRKERRHDRLRLMPRETVAARDESTREDGGMVDAAYVLSVEAWRRGHGADARTSCG